MTLSRSLKLAALALVFALGAGAAAAADSKKEPTLSKEDQACLSCHAKPGMRKALGDGESLSLYVAPQAFAASRHNSEGCEGCHSQIDNKTHGKVVKDVASRRAYAREVMETCRDCHKKTMKQYDDSVHAALVREGSGKAPLCSDCHDPHATRSAKDAPAAGTDTASVQCANCHKPLVEAFAGSVHALAGDEALDCKDCHRTHDIKAAAVGTHLRTQCVSCHKEAVAAHASWLPNSARHLEAIACAACHAPGATRRVDLRLFEAAPGGKAVEKVGVPQFVNFTSTAGTAGLDGRALWSLLQDLNRDPAESRTFVRGRLEVANGVQSHSLAKGKALKDCATCHKPGAAAFQGVTISMVGADGRPVRQAASAGILGSLESLGSVGGFYAIGSTRIKVLDWLLVMAVGAGIALPGAHLAAKLVTARRRARAAAVEEPNTDGGM
ncbi:MAG: hypothetical protein HY854_21540 [Burkholderiales bacterium]|nr:hypothetical protein [Burkholderiales bacterium]